MATKKTIENLASLVALQMMAFLVLEIVIWLLIAAGILPPTLVLSIQQDMVLKVNTAYIVIAGLVSILMAGFWLAILTELVGIVELKEIKINL